MRESATCFHNLEWPAEGACLAGPVVWLRGWVVGKPGHDFGDVRVRHEGLTHLGVLGLPRTDLAAHFGSPRPWLPAEFILGVPLNDGPVTLTLEAMDALGAWHSLQSIALTVAATGTPPPRVEGRLETQATGSWTVRDAHHPYHGHLDLPGPQPTLQRGQAPVFGWLLDETRPLQAVLATTDGLVFNHLDHSLTDEALATKVPQHTAARHARLRGTVDFPAPHILPACLRVYAVAPDASVHLCFAQRIQPRTAPTPALATAPTYPPPLERALPDLPSGRPRRLLMVLQALLPNDATLRAFDLARHLTASHRWAARIVSTEDGPMRQTFEQIGVEAMIVDPLPLLAAGGPAETEQALARLAREIRWDHLDAVAVFDPICGWALTVARQRGIPTVFDCIADEPLQTDPTASPAVRSLLQESWRTATAICFASDAAARAQATTLAGCTADVIPMWHTPGIQLATPPEAAAPRVAIAPLRTADWLWRRHPEIAAQWSFRQGPAGLTPTERLARQDDAFNVPGVQHMDDWSIAGISLCLGPLFARGPIRPLLDAAAAGVPFIAPVRPTTLEIFCECRLPMVAEDNPSALAHALLAQTNLPDLWRRETALAAEIIRTRHAPALLLPRWEDLLARATAAGR